MIASNNIRVPIKKGGPLDRLLILHYAKKRREQYMSSLLSSLGLVPEGNQTRELMRGYYDVLFPQDKQSAKKATDRFVEVLRKAKEKEKNGSRE